MSAKQKRKLFFFLESRKRFVRARPKITPYFHASIHPAWLHCSLVKSCYLSFSRLAMRAPQPENINLIFERTLMINDPGMLKVEFLRNLAESAASSHKPVSFFKK
jgi:hypothetical protein